MINEEIETKMREFAEVLKYKFNDISWLKKAMGSKKIKIKGQGKNSSEYENERLAIVGDAVLKSVIADYLYSVKENATKGYITKVKSKLESNSVLHEIMEKKGWLKYAYNDLHFYDENNPPNEQVVCGEHDPYIEAIVGAMYYDLNYDKTKEWIVDQLLPLLEEYSDN